MHQPHTNVKFTLTTTPTGKVGSCGTSSEFGIVLARRNILSVAFMMAEASGLVYTYGIEFFS
jgi:hypothetical protein